MQWNPRPHTLAKLKSYLAGFQAHSRAIYAKRRYIAARIGIGVRTLSRYLAYLHDVGWIATIQRTARTAIRKISAGAVLVCGQPAIPFAPLSGAGSIPARQQPTGTPTGTSKEVTPEASRKRERLEGFFPSVVFLFNRALGRKRPSQDACGVSLAELRDWTRQQLAGRRT